MFKQAVAEVVIQKLEPIQAKYKELIENKDYLKSIYQKGAIKASQIANKTLEDVYNKIGMIL